jgi:hypothetical protein
MRKRQIQSLPAEIEAQVMWARKEGPRLDIPWMDFSEEEIQSILKLHYEALGFAVQWPHAEDASHEKGIDLECIHPSRGRVIIAVKKNPRSEDIVQLQEFSRNDANLRIYVRIRRGTQKFEDETHRVGGIEFWDSTRLERELDASGLTTILVLECSAFATELLFVCASLRKARQVEGKIKHTEPVTLDVLWDLKDRVVTLNKGLSLLQFIFERATFLRELGAYETREFLAPALKFLSIQGSRPLAEAIETQDPGFLELVRKAYVKTHTRSNWKNMALITLPDLLHPGMSTEQLKYESTQPWDACCNFFRRFGILVDGVEGTLDYMFQESEGKLGDEN